MPSPRRPGMARSCRFPHDVRRIITGLPTASIEVVVPVDMLMPFAQHAPDQDPWAGHHGAAPDQDASATYGQPPVHGSLSADGPPCVRDAGPRPAGVAEIVGHGFLTTEQVHEILLTPGSTLHRLLTDPADGRLVERSIAAYRPDATMLAQVRAADRFCRAPGCLVPAHRCEVDHEQPFGDGGATAEPNLGLKHGPHHQSKTERLWSSMMDQTRVVTWRTLFGRIYRTRAHDYRQYGAPPGTGEACRSGGAQKPPLPQRLLGVPDPSMAQDPGTVQDPDLRDRLVYAALCSRSTRDRYLEGDDDYETDAWVRDSRRGLNVFHRVQGRRRSGPPPQQVTPEVLLLPPVPPPAPAPLTDPPF